MLAHPMSKVVSRIRASVSPNDPPERSARMPMRAATEKEPIVSRMIQGRKARVVLVDMLRILAPGAPSQPTHRPGRERVVRSGR